MPAPWAEGALAAAAGRRATSSTRDEVPDPGNLKIELEMNGETMQSSTTAEMIFEVPSLIEHISQFATSSRAT
jgi:2-keto-4-pentenoate hydratase/2-oxohepta-3-ene-1,7-dioic acid hydratase in catechol pathway